MPKTWRTETDISGRPAPLRAASRVMGVNSLFVAFQGAAQRSAMVLQKGGSVATCASPAGYASPACRR